MTEAELISQLLTLWMEEAPERVNVNHCILGTRAAIEIGAYFGFQWKPLAVDIAVFNQPGLDLFLQGVPHQDWPPEAHSLGCVCHDFLGATGWDGHVIVQTGEQLFDLAGAQFHRPERNILLDGPWATPAPTDEGPWFAQRDGMTIVLWPRPEIGAYRQAPDWKQGYKTLAAVLIRRLKAITELETTS
jgi:hypothetical protein